MELLLQIGSVLLLVLGFGFVIFVHELGHFLAAKAVGIKVEQFAVGFGHALLCYRKGVGLTIGTSAPEAERLRLAGRTDVGETEYRLNWIPLGGYVKMLGQEDIGPSESTPDPRAYNNKPVGARMLVVCAGVIMNVLLAAALFMGLFLWGYNTPSNLVGSVATGSPAQQAGIHVGDRIVRIGSHDIPDFTKVQLNIALLSPGETVPVVVQRGDQSLTLDVLPRKPTGNPREFLAIGVGGTPALRGPPPHATLRVRNPEQLVLPDVLALLPGDVIVAIEGRPIPPELPGRPDIPSHYLDLYRALQEADGRPVRLRVRSLDGNERDVDVRPYLAGAFGGGEVTVAGLVPRPMVQSINEASSAVGRLRPGDVVLSVQFDDTRDVVDVHSMAELREQLAAAGAAARPVTLTVERRDAGRTERLRISGLTPNIPLGDGRRGLGIAMGYDADSAAFGAVAPGSAADRAGIRPGGQVLRVAGREVANLFELRRALLAQNPAEDIELVVTDGARQTTHSLRLTDDERRDLAGLQATHLLQLDERIEPRRTSNPLVAAAWGASETRDFILQGYLTLKRMIQGSVSPANLTGPVGIFHFGGRIATEKSTDWLIWFLAMISANLAVVNFLPIPIVDGGLFVFLVLEKLTGKPLSPRAQAVAQLIGLAIILSVFVFVTYNDIARLLG
ncbi:MAG: site-2 protease family protein [Tepidisphaerales bacterium]